MRRTETVVEVDTSLVLADTRPSSYLAGGASACCDQRARAATARLAPLAFAARRTPHALQATRRGPTHFRFLRHALGLPPVLRLLCSLSREIPGAAQGRQRRTTGSASQPGQGRAQSSGCAGLALASASADLEPSQASAADGHAPMAAHAHDEPGGGTLRGLFRGHCSRASSTAASAAGAVFDRLRQRRSNASMLSRLPGLIHVLARAVRANGVARCKPWGPRRHVILRPNCAAPRRLRRRGTAAASAPPRARCRLNCQFSAASSWQKCSTRPLRQAPRQASPVCALQRLPTRLPAHHRSVTRPAAPAAAPKQERQRAAGVAPTTAAARHPAALLHYAAPRPSTPASRRARRAPQRMPARQLGALRRRLPHAQLRQRHQAGVRLAQPGGARASLRGRDYLRQKVRR